MKDVSCHSYLKQTDARMTADGTVLRASTMATADIVRTLQHEVPIGYCY